MYPVFSGHVVFMCQLNRFRSIRSINDWVPNSENDGNSPLLLQLWWPVGLPAPPQSPGSNEASLEICPPINFRKETAAIPIGSMYGIYANIGGILMVKYGKCYHIYHTWILWDRLKKLRVQKWERFQRL